LFFLNNKLDYKNYFYLISTAGLIIYFTDFTTPLSNTYSIYNDLLEPYINIIKSLWDKLTTYFNNSINSLDSTSQVKKELESVLKDSTLQIKNEVKLGIKEAINETLNERDVSSESPPASSSPCPEGRAINKTIGFN
jgi:hypothetical protein